MKMEPTEFLSIIQTCVQEKRFAILKCLLTNGKMGYSDLNTYTGGTESARFSYHLRKLTRCKVVQRNEVSSTYTITERGARIVSLVENNLKKKYISEDGAGVCSNDEEGNHTLITICTKCSWVKKI